MQAPKQRQSPSRVNPAVVLPIAIMTLFLGARIKQNVENPKQTDIPQMTNNQKNENECFSKNHVLPASAVNNMPILKITFLKNISF